MDAAQGLLRRHRADVPQAAASQAMGLRLECGAHFAFQELDPAIAHGIDRERGCALAAVRDHRRVKTRIRPQEIQRATTSIASATSMKSIGERRNCRYAGSGEASAGTPAIHAL